MVLQKIKKETFFNSSLADFDINAHNFFILWAKAIRPHSTFTLARLLNRNLLKQPLPLIIPKVASTSAQRCFLKAVPSSEQRFLLTILLCSSSSLFTS